MAKELSDYRIEIYVPRTMAAAVEREAATYSLSISGFLKALIARNVPGAVAPHLEEAAE